MAEEKNTDRLDRLIADKEQELATIQTEATYDTLEQKLIQNDLKATLKVGEITASWLKEVSQKIGAAIDELGHGFDKGVDLMTRDITKDGE